MAKLLSVFGRAGAARVLDPVGAALVRAGVSPNTVTVAGTAGVLIGCLGFVTRGHILTGLIIVTLSCLTDLVDGAMARAKGGGSTFGAFLDSTMDRVADGAIFGSLAFWLGTQDRPWAAGAALLALVLGQVVSYAKARAEGLGMTCNVGVAERPERLILIGIGGLGSMAWPWFMDGALWLLAVLSLITVWQRMAHVYRQATR
ncbi:phosphatidylinositol phosphate synthase [Longispora albida]|uniref:phosphatidylinositol phosphate synthase n=1 Tax=Longispora albida TaxID=203523 RepID=UPI00037E4A83|nr:CDP-alcohol phosphatidyltransferase family protein [Longispora albida]